MLCSSSWCPRQKARLSSGAAMSACSIDRTKTSPRSFCRAIELPRQHDQRRTRENEAERSDPVQHAKAPHVADCASMLHERPQNHIAPQGQSSRDVHRGGGNPQNSAAVAKYEQKRSDDYTFDSGYQKEASSELAG